MRQVNFTLIFVICLSLVLFGLENTQVVSIRLIQGIVLRAPLSVVLVVTLGLGALFAWVFSVWINFSNPRWLHKVPFRPRMVQIEALQTDLEHYKAELEEQQRLLPSASASSPRPQRGLNPSLSDTTQITIQSSLVKEVRVAQALSCQYL